MIQLGFRVNKADFYDNKVFSGEEQMMLGKCKYIGFVNKIRKGNIDH